MYLSLHPNSLPHFSCNSHLFITSFNGVQPALKQLTVNLPLASGLPKSPVFIPGLSEKGHEIGTSGRFRQVS